MAEDKKRICEFFLLDGSGYKKCERGYFGIARRHDLCLTHFSRIRKDNLKRIHQEMDIPDSFETIIKLGKYDLSSCTLPINKPYWRPSSENEDDGSPEVESIAEEEV